MKKEKPSQEEIAKIIEEKGIELTDEQLERFSGGSYWDEHSEDAVCPTCGFYLYETNETNAQGKKRYVCELCGDVYL